MSVRIDEWTKLNCGDRLRHRDGRHVHRVRAVIGNVVRLTCETNNYTVEIDLFRDYLSGEWIRLKPWENE